MKVYNIAILGCGMISKSHFKALATLPNVNIVACADVVESKAKANGDKLGIPYFTDCETMLKEVPEIEVVMILLPTYLHSEYIQLCAKYKKAIICEKPYSMTVDQALKAKAAVEEAGVPYMTLQVVRFWTGYVIIKKMMEEGELGDILMGFFSRNSERQVWDNYWLFDTVNGGGAMYDMMVHDIDYMNYLFGPAKTVYSIASKDDTGCYDDVFTSITYMNGVKAVAETEFNMHTGYPFTMAARIVGTKATCELVYAAGETINDRDSVNATLKIYREGQEPEIIQLDLYDPYAKETAYFLDCLDKGIAPSVVTAADSVEVIRTVNAMKESADTNTVVEIKR